MRGFNFNFQVNYLFANPYNLIYLEEIYQIIFILKDFSVGAKLLWKIQVEQYLA